MPMKKSAAKFSENTDFVLSWRTKTFKWLLFANFPDISSFAQIHSKFSVHPMISVEFNFSSSHTEQLKSLYSFRNVDLPKIAEKILISQLEI